MPERTPDGDVRIWGESRMVVVDNDQTTLLIPLPPCTNGIGYYVDKEDRPTKAVDRLQIVAALGPALKAGDTVTEETYPLLFGRVVGVLQVWSPPPELQVREGGGKSDRKQCQSCKQLKSPKSFTSYKGCCRYTTPPHSLCVDCVANLPPGKFVGDECPCCGIPRFESAAFRYNFDVQRPLALRACTDLAGRPHVEDDDEVCRPDLAGHPSPAPLPVGGVYGQSLSEVPVVWVDPSGRLLACVTRTVAQGITRVQDNDYLQGAGAVRLPSDDAGLPANYVLTGARLYEIMHRASMASRIPSALKCLENGKAGTYKSRVDLIEKLRKMDYANPQNNGQLTYQVPDEGRDVRSGMAAAGVTVTHWVWHDHQKGVTQVVLSAPPPPGSDVGGVTVTYTWPEPPYWVQTVDLTDNTFSVGTHVEASEEAAAEAAAEAAEAAAAAPVPPKLVFDTGMAALLGDRRVLVAQVEGRAGQQSPAYTVMDIYPGEDRTNATSRMRPGLIGGWPTKKTGTEETSAVPYDICLGFPNPLGGLGFAKPTVILEAGTTLWYGGEAAPAGAAAGAAELPYGGEGDEPQQLHLFEGLEGPCGPEAYLTLGVFQHVAGMSAVTVNTIMMTVELNGNVMELKTKKPERPAQPKKKRDHTEEAERPKKKKKKKRHTQNLPQNLTFNPIPGVRTTWVWKVLVDDYLQPVPEPWQDKLNAAYEAYTKGGPEVVDGLDAQAYDGGATYRINFAEMRQTREDDPKKFRPVKKEAKPVESSKRHRDLRVAGKCVACEANIDREVVLLHGSPAGGGAAPSWCRNELCGECARCGDTCTRCMQPIAGVYVDGIRQGSEDREDECFLCCGRGGEALPCDQATKVCKGCLLKAKQQDDRCPMCRKPDCVTNV
jgi:hypothetical protein